MRAGVVRPILCEALAPRHELDPEDPHCLTKSIVGNVIR